MLDEVVHQYKIVNKIIRITREIPYIGFTEKIDQCCIQAKWTGINLKK